METNIMTINFKRFANIVKNEYSSNNIVLTLEF